MKWRMPPDSYLGHPMETRLEAAEQTGSGGRSMMLVWKSLSGWRYEVWVDGRSGFGRCKTEARAIECAKARIVSLGGKARRFSSRLGDGSARGLDHAIG